MFAKIRKTGYVSTNQGAKMTPKYANEYLSKVHESSIENRRKALFYIVLHCGPKTKELQELKPSDVSADSDGITIQFPKRSIRINDAKAKFSIVNWISHINAEMNDCPIFSSLKRNKALTGKPLSSVSINNIVKDFFGIGVRDFRRMFIQEVIESNMTKAKQQEVIGVKSYAAINHYISNENENC